MPPVGNVVWPRAGTDGFKDDQACIRSYALTGFGSRNSSQLVMNGPPVVVKAGQSFNLAYSEALYNFQNQNNEGQTCADVYLTYGVASLALGFFLQSSSRDSSSFSSNCEMMPPPGVSFDQGPAQGVEHVRGSYLFLSTALPPLGVGAD